MATGVGAPAGAAAISAGAGLVAAGVAVVAGAGALAVELGSAAWIDFRNDLDAYQDAKGKGGGSGSKDAEKLPGEKGTQTTNKTTGQNGKTGRIDVEKPAPGKRAGQIHYHDADNQMWRYDLQQKCFYNPQTNEIAPRCI